MRAAAATSVVAVVVPLAACSPDLPQSVDKGSTITVGWSQRLTTLNGATTAGAGIGDQEIASITHDGFARVVDGEVVTDPTFGTVSVTDDDPASFTVRYDLADRTWSDGVPLDAADLLLAWAAGSGVTEGGFDAAVGDLRQSTDDVPTMDDFARRIDVTYTTPVEGWQTDLAVAVPAHVVGEQALGIDDPMEAKQAVIDAITDGDSAALAAIAEVWNTGFDLDDAADLPEHLTVASGLYQVSAVERSDSGIDHVTLEVNRRYGGDVAPTYETVDVVAAPTPLEQFPTDLDVVQTSPTPDNFAAVRELERRDQHVAITDDGQLWMLALRADRGVFRSPEARLAFLRAAPRNDLRTGGAGKWDDAYATTQSLLFAPGDPGYTIALEDSGLVATYENTTDDPAVDRAQAGVAAGTKVCVLYDTRIAFAGGAFAALRTAAAESGWTVQNCGRKGGLTKAIQVKKKWSAVLTTVPLPQSPDDITRLWGGEQPSELTGATSAERARLVAEMDQTPDRYDLRDLQVEVETGLVADALALPLSLEPVLTLSERSINLIQPDSGGAATLLSGAGGWAPER